VAHDPYSAFLQANNQPSKEAQKEEMLIKLQMENQELKAQADRLKDRLKRSSQLTASEGVAQTAALAETAAELQLKEEEIRQRDMCVPMTITLRNSLFNIFLLLCILLFVNATHTT
tara:strand:- start:1780 stop:2127 length:348 start_codon:yes stop_codon:yes gene_type:complete